MSRKGSRGLADANTTELQRRSTTESPGAEKAVCAEARSVGVRIAAASSIEIALKILLAISHLLLAR
jgi:hypothetical protein